MTAVASELLTVGDMAGPSAPRAGGRHC
jgi:hypothetical protein